MKSNIWLFVAIGVIAYLVIAGNPFADGEKTTTTTTPTGSTMGCAVEDISFSPSMVRKNLVGTSVASANYFVTTDNQGSKSGSLTVPTNYDMQVIFGENSTTYYSKVVELNTDCQDPYPLSVELGYADSTPTVTTENGDDGQPNTVSNPHVAEADDVIEFEVCIRASSDQYIGNPDSDCQNIGVVEYDATYFRKVEGSLGGAVISSNAFSAQRVNATNDAEQAFIIPKLGDGEKECFTIQMETTSSDVAATNAQPVFHIFDCDIDKNEDTLEIIEGVEDEDNNRLSLITSQTTLYVS